MHTCHECPKEASEQKIAKIKMFLESNTDACPSYPYTDGQKIIMPFLKPFTLL
jgi:hypothetical protein